MILRKKQLIGTALVLSLIYRVTVLAQSTTLHEFITETGIIHYNGLATDGEFIFGSKFDGGSRGSGYLYRMRTDGSDFEIIFDFVDDQHGRNPVGGLILHEGYLYGMTAFGGSDDLGVIFKINPDGTEYAAILNFDGWIGALPFSNLMVAGDVLYGVTPSSGSYGRGTIFKVNTDGSNPELLHTFTGPDLWYPAGKLTLIGSTLYGGTKLGGAGNYGTLFKLKVDGSGFKVIHEFSDDNGSYFDYGMVTDGKRLYGVTLRAVLSDGVIFKVDTTGADFQMFNCSPFNAHVPTGVVLKGDRLYGMTTHGGIRQQGTIFSLDTSFVSFNILRQLDATSGIQPKTSVLLHGDTLFAPLANGEFNYGTVVRVNTDGSGFAKLTDFTSSNTGYDPRGIIAYQGRNYGVTQGGGKYNCGVIYSIRADGTDFRLLHEFNGSDGKRIDEGLTLVDSTLFGLTFFGGSEDSGTMFKINCDGTGFEKLLDFTSSMGRHPRGPLVVKDSILYGLLRWGGPGDKGVIFTYDLRDRGYDPLLFFGNTEEGGAEGPLVIHRDKLYGLAYTNESQSIYSINPDGSDYTRIVEKDPLTGGQFDGAIVVTDTVIYGVARQGGPWNVGVLYQVNPDGTNLQALYEFNYDVAAAPEPQLLLSGDTLFGVAALGGIDRVGGVFGFKITSREFFYLDETPANGRTKASKRRATAFQARVAMDNRMLYGTSISDYGFTRAGELFSYDLTTTGAPPVGSPPAEPPPVVTGLSDVTAVAVYPNPATEELHIDGLPGRVMYAELYDMMGRTYPCEFILAGHGYIIPLQNVRPGLYVLNIATSQGRHRVKFIKK